MYRYIAFAMLCGTASFAFADELHPFIEGLSISALITASCITWNPMTAIRWLPRSQRAKRETSRAHGKLLVGKIESKPEIAHVGR